ncbi:MAG: site-2 protease family protein [Candidatus Limnocylindrales bacterium]
MGDLFTPDAIFRIVVLGAVFLLVAFPIHEASHAWMANRLGDSTARYMGRLTLDPTAHFDPMGGGLLLLSLVASGGTFAVGMAKPTPVNPSNLRGGRRGEMWVALAGPVSNLIMAAVGALIIRIIVAVPGLTNLVLTNQVADLLFGALETFVFIDIVLFIFNLIPVPPLDGWTVLAGLVPPKVAWDMARARATIGLYGMLIVFAFIFLGGSTFLSPILDSIFGLLTGLPY